MSITRRTVLYLTITVALALGGRGLDARAQDRGPAIGKPIPHNLEVRDQRGQARGFKTLTGKRGLLLLFSRSLDW